MHKSYLEDYEAMIEKLARAGYSLANNKDDIAKIIASHPMLTFGMLHRLVLLSDLGPYLMENGEIGNTLTTQKQFAVYLIWAIIICAT